VNQQCPNDWAWSSKSYSPLLVHDVPLLSSTTMRNSREQHWTVTSDKPEVQQYHWVV